MVWCSLAAAVLIQPLAWESPYAAGVALKGKKKKIMLWSVVTGSPEGVSQWPGLTGAEDVNGVRGSRDSGRVTGTSPQRTLNARLEDLD